MDDINRLDIIDTLTQRAGMDDLLGATPSVDPINESMSSVQRIAGLLHPTPLNRTPMVSKGATRPFSGSLIGELPTVELDTESADGEDPWWEDLGAAGQSESYPDAMRAPLSPEMLPQSDGESKVSEDDSTQGFLEDKITGGSGITVSTTGGGGDEKIVVSQTGNLDSVRVTATDTTGGYLDGKITVDGIWITKNIVNPGADEVYDIDHAGPQGGAHANILTLGSYIVAYDDHGHFIGRWDSKGSNWSGLGSATEPTSTTDMD